MTVKTPGTGRIIKMSKTTFVVATHNPHKLKEFARILEPLEIEIVTPAQCGGEGIDPVEDGDTFEANAIIKATEFAKALHMPALADDSGICVDALGGAPGVYSARYSGGNDDDNNEFLLKNLEGIPFEQRTARYVCVICCAYPDGEYFTVRGECAKSQRQGAETACRETCRKITRKPRFRKLLGGR